MTNRIKASESVLHCPGSQPSCMFHVHLGRRDTSIQAPPIGREIASYIVDCMCIIRSKTFYKCTIVRSLHVGQLEAWSLGCSWACWLSSSDMLIFWSNMLVDEQLMLPHLRRLLSLFILVSSARVFHMSCIPTTPVLNENRLIVHVLNGQV